MGVRALDKRHADSGKPKMGMPTDVSIHRRFDVRCHKGREDGQHHAIQCHLLKIILD